MIALWWAFAFLLGVTGQGQEVVQAQAQAREVTFQFGSGKFEETWQRTDLPIAAQKVPRSWYWGPAPLAGGLYEDYANSPFHSRQVQYFDKARMELNSPDTGVVTNGLLVVEMVSGRLQAGDNTFVDKEPAKVAVAGDPDNLFPTYRDLKPIYNLAQPGRGIGEMVQDQLLPSGRTASLTTYRADSATKIATLDNGLAIPAAFWDYLNRSGPVYQQGRYTSGLISDWLFSTGHPVTEAYWTRVRVGEWRKTCCSRLSNGASLPIRQLTTQPTRSKWATSGCIMSSGVTGVNFPLSQVLWKAFSAAATLASRSGIPLTRC